MKEKTISNNLIISGIGLHSGQKMSIELIPSSCGYIYFTNRNNQKEQLKTLFNNVTDTNLGTTISDGKIKVLTIEHIMSALWACDINSLEILIDGDEIPILDGSAFRFIQEIKSIGTTEIEKNKQYLIIKNEVIIDEGDKFIKISPNDSLVIDMTVNYSYGSIGKQHLTFYGSKDKFITEISKARTFCQEKDVEYMHSVGLAKGGNLNNSLVFNENGLINQDGLRYDDEIVRHKILDCIGDIYTCGFDIIGKIEAYKSGHTLDNLLIRKLFENDGNYSIEIA